MDEFASFPTPLALIAQRRFHVAPNDFRQRFENALLLGEAAIKWLATTAVGLLAPHNPTAAHAVGYDLVRADGVGEWTTKLNLLGQRLHRCPPAHPRVLARFLTAKVPKGDATSPSPWPAAIHLAQILEALDSPDFEESGRQKKSFVDLCADFAFLRNRTRGHGAKTPSFYEQTAGAAEAMASQICAQLQFPFFWAAVLRADEAGTADALRLLGSSPCQQVRIEGVGIADSNSLYIADEAGRASPCPKLVCYRSAQRAFLFANGAWREANLKGRFLDYVTGDDDAIHVPEFGGARPVQPDSQTAGSPSLSYTHGAMHNLPPQGPGYISRAALERDIEALLRDRVHRILTLKGPGGIGKTSLALQVLQRLVATADCQFDVVLWFSARDVDLLLEGPAARRRAVKSVDSIAKFFVELLELRTSADEDARAVFVEQIGRARDTLAILLVIDNFETLDDPEGTHRFLDTHIVLPSKLLITSRHRTYRGDFWLDVPGMEDDEARRLLLEEARANLCEPRMTDQVIQRIVEHTGAAPYAMKLAVGHLARAHGLESTLRPVLGRDDVLDALFDRSYRLLSGDGQFFYHLLGELRKPAPEVVASGLMAGVGLNHFSAADEACGLSLVQVTEGDEGGRLYFLPHAAQFHASRELVGHPDEMRIRHEAESVRGLIHPQEKSRIIERFFDASIRRLTGTSEFGDSEKKLRVSATLS